VIVKEVREPIHMHSTGGRMQVTEGFPKKGLEYQQTATSEGFATGKATVLEKTVTVQRTHSEISPQ